MKAFTGIIKKYANCGIKFGFLLICIAFLLASCEVEHPNLSFITVDLYVPFEASSKGAQEIASIDVGYVDKDYYVKAVSEDEGAYCSLGSGYAKLANGTITATLSQGKWDFYVITTDLDKYSATPSTFTDAEKGTETVVSTYVNLHTSLINLLENITKTLKINFYYETDLTKGYDKQNIHIVYQKLQGKTFVDCPQPVNKLSYSYETGLFSKANCLVLSGEEEFASKGTYIAKVYVVDTATNENLLVDTLAVVIGEGPLATVRGYSSLEKPENYTDPTKPDTNWILEKEENTESGATQNTTTEMKEPSSNGSNPTVSDGAAYVLQTSKNTDTDFDLNKTSGITRINTPAANTEFGINVNGKVVVLKVTGASTSGQETSVIELGTNNTMTLYNRPSDNSEGLWAKLSSEQKTRVHSNILVGGNSTLNVGTSLTTAHLNVVGAGITYPYPIEFEATTYYYAPVLCQTNYGGTINVDGNITISGNVGLGSFDDAGRNVILNNNSKCTYNILNGAQIDALGGNARRPLYSESTPGNGIWVKGQNTEVSILLSGSGNNNGAVSPSKIYAHGTNADKGIVLENCSKVNITIENGAVIDSTGAAITLSNCNNATITIQGIANLSNNKNIVLTNTTATIICNGKEFTRSNTTVDIASLK